jgi:hypothetical protein
MILVNNNDLDNSSNRNNNKKVILIFLLLIVSLFCYLYFGTDLFKGKEKEETKKEDQI